jgi:hypothetical protein
MVEGFLDYNNGIFVLIKNNAEHIIDDAQAYQFYTQGVEASMAALEVFEEAEYEDYMTHAFKDEL